MSLSVTINSEQFMILKKVGGGRKGGRKVKARRSYADQNKPNTTDRQHFDRLFASGKFHTGTRSALICSALSLTVKGVRKQEWSILRL